MHFLKRPVGFITLQMSRSFSRRVAPLRRPAEKPARAVSIRNEQTDIDINEAVLEQQANDIMNILNVSDYFLSIVLCSDDMMKAYHKECLVTYESTDVISLRVQHFLAPEVFASKWKISRSLGQIIICPAFVHRVAMQDKEERESGEYEIEDEDDAGVSLAISTIDSTKDRISLLLIHGMLHLLGHDHETDSDWILMTGREEQVLRDFMQLPSWRDREHHAIIKK